MKHISLVVYEGVLSTAVSNTLALLTSANEAAVRKGMPVPFQIDLIGIEEKRYNLPFPFYLSAAKSFRIISIRKLSLFPYEYGSRGYRVFTGAK